MVDRTPAQTTTSIISSLSIAICTTLLLGATTFAAPPAQARAITHNLDIPAQELGAALKALGAAANEQMLFADEVVAGFHSPDVKGEYSTDEAVTLLLKGSGLKADRTPSGVLLIRSADASPSTSLLRGEDSSNALRSGWSSSGVGKGVTEEAAKGKGFWDRLRIAQADPSTSSSERQKASQSPSENPEIQQIEEIVVTGSHIRGATVAGSRVITIDRLAIEESGHGRLQDIIEAVPQNFTGVSEDFNQSSVSNLTFGAEIQLRGLGAGTTLTLVNGRRLPGGGSLGAFTDIASIPAAAIERVEILADGASAIYGSDAIGGVANIILRKNLEGAESSMRFGTYDGDADEMELSQVLGHRWSNGSALLGYQYTEREPLLYGSRPYAASGADFTAFGGSDLRRASSFRRGASPGNILNPAGQVAYAIPAGQNGTALTAAQLLPGQINYPDVSYANILPDQESHSVFANLSQRLGERVDLSFDARYNVRDMHHVSPGNSITVSVPSTNPFYVNPFGGTAPVRVEYDFVNDVGGFDSQGKVKTFAASLGPVIDIGHDWQLAVSGSYAQERTQWARTRINSTAVTAALNDSDRATALNVFGNGTANNPETLARILLHEFDSVKNASASAEVIVDGPLFALPGGHSKLAAGTAYHRDTMDIVSNFSARNGRADGRRESVAAFAELTLPLVGPMQDIPLVRGLDVFLAGRYDDYKDFGETFNPKVGATWSPIEPLRLRGTWGTSFRAPPFYMASTDINRPSVSTIQVAAPAGSTPTVQVAGVATDLVEETADVWSAGLDFTPLGGLEISATYFAIEYDGRIGSPFSSLAFALANEQLFAGTGLIILDPSPAQLAAFCANPAFIGTCTGNERAIVDNRRRNIAVTEVDGIDVAISYRLETAIGLIRVGADGSYLLSYDEAVTDRSAAIDVVDTFRRPVSLRLRGTAGWSLGGWSASAAVNFTDSYRNPAPAARIDAWTTFDLGVGYRFDEEGASFLSGTKVRLSATNIFNKEPPFVNVDVGAGGYDPANASLVGRSASLQIEKKW